MIKVRNSNVLIMLIASEKQSTVKYQLPYLFVFGLKWQNPAVLTHALSKCLQANLESPIELKGISLNCGKKLNMHRYVDCRQKGPRIFLP